MLPQRLGLPLDYYKRVCDAPKPAPPALDRDVGVVGAQERGRFREVIPPDILVDDHRGGRDTIRGRGFFPVEKEREVSFSRLVEGANPLDVRLCVADELGVDGIRDWR